METVILLAQAASVLFIALWLTSGVHDNLRHPKVNEMFTAEVMDMARMREGFPEAYALVAHRRITSRLLQVLAFRFVVTWEALSALALWIGCGAMVLAFFGAAAVETAKALALLGALMFTTTWAAFLIVGNYFNYWFGHEGAQNTHFQMTLWGMAVMIFLVSA
ncbi:MAG: DUF2165 family protein [Pseudomonadota bacterium]